MATHRSQPGVDEHARGGSRNRRTGPEQDPHPRRPAAAHHHECRHRAGHQSLRTPGTRRRAAGIIGRRTSAPSELMPAVSCRKRRSHRDLRRCRPRIVRRHCTHATAGGLLGISPSLATHRQVLAGRPEEEGADPAAAAAGPLLRVDGPRGFGRVRARVQHGRSGVVRGPRHRSAAAGTAVTTQRYGYRIATSGTGANAAGTSAMAGTRCAAGIAAEGVAGGCSPAVASACRCCPGGRPSP